jgi:hypothetical protein
MSCYILDSAGDVLIDGQDGVGTSVPTYKWETKPTLSAAGKSSMRYSRVILNYTCHMAFNVRNGLGNFVVSDFLT